MAHHSATKKAIRQTAKRTEQNRARRSQIRTAVKKTESAIAANDQKAAKEAFLVAQKELDRGVQKGVYKQGTVSRKLSRLNAAIKKLAA